MKKLIILTLLVCSISVHGFALDSLGIAKLQREVFELKKNLSNLRQENSQIRTLYQDKSIELDSLKSVQEQQSKSIKALANKLSTDLSVANKKIDDSTNTLSDSIHNRTRLFVCGILIALVLLGIVFFILRKKILSGSSSIDRIRAAQESLETAQKTMQEESVKLDNRLIELLDKHIAAQPEGNGNDQPDHSLALKVADEIVRIETNLFRMDTNIRGYNQLKHAVRRIRENFLANGYEIVEMFGKPYNEGMKVVANFVSDDTLAEGEQKITGIIKPQINYKGKMIQSAQITVSQNL